MLLISLELFEKSLATVKNTNGDQSNLNFIRLLGIRRKFSWHKIAHYRDNLIVRFFNDIVAKQWPRPLKFVRETRFKHNAKVTCVRQRTDDNGNTIIHITITGNRYCLNIGREHRSNGIYFVVNERANVYHQKCFDYSCRGSALGIYY